METPVRTEVNELLSHGSILEVKALWGFLHSKLMLDKKAKFKENLRPPV